MPFAQIATDAGSKQTVRPVASAVTIGSVFSHDPINRFFEQAIESFELLQLIGFQIMPQHSRQLIAHQIQPLLAHLSSQSGQIKQASHLKL